MAELTTQQDKRKRKILRRWLDQEISGKQADKELLVNNITHEKLNGNNNNLKSDDGDYD